MVQIKHHIQESFNIFTTVYSWLAETTITGEKFKDYVRMGVKTSLVVYKMVKEFNLSSKKRGENFAAIRK